MVLPAAGFTEKNGTVTNLERRLRRIAQAEEPPGEALPDWKIIQLISRRLGAPLGFGSAGEIMNEIRSIVPIYRELAPGVCWERERSPLYGTIADLSLPYPRAAEREVITAGRLLFSSGAMTTRSKELSTIERGRAKVAR